jgi:hypothetical protein
MAEPDPLDRLVEAGFPRDTLALYGRWWQLETWLRELVYTELRSERGLEWENALGKHTASRVDRDELNRYMASADAGDLLAYLDVRLLFEIIGERWELFEPCMPPRVRWDGMADELRAIRHRVAHLRRPHRDDLARVEQALRDLDHGARTFYAAYAASRKIDERGPVALGWLRGQHPVASRRILHADDQYGTTFKLRASARPWAPTARAELGDRGALWHAEWRQTGAAETDPVDFWQGLGRLRGQAGRDAQRLATHVLWPMSGHVTITFAAIDDAQAIADAIGECFDVLLMEARSRRDEPIGDENLWRGWTSRNDLLPGRVQVGSALSMADAEMPFRVLEP